ncbi:class I SAM-dependent methyltransferase [Streptomyces pinistramenti]|uniref:class I SAM-dependent methyltransferase n=1 Tax=Streptomyces pinistramenti TaxID=2884812 RepID=UPI001D097FC4|nr:class I SAM-dependent methyltransferase [Streptomyces pinistramenti]MCB5909107.1 class I SAM-dependent methyltransferase [Streptomyces pinistramenti]
MTSTPPGSPSDPYGTALGSTPDSTPHAVPDTASDTVLVAASGAEPASTEEIWDARYRAGDKIFSGDPNTALVRETAGLRPGTALDLGCGEGADAVWLASRGWRVTATDVSPTALRRAARQATAAGVGDRIDWQHHDLDASFPEGEFDLVSAHFLYPPLAAARERILRTSSRAVAPGGLLLIVSHAGPPFWDHDLAPEVHFPTPEEILTALDLPAVQWEVQVSETYHRPATSPGGESGTRADSTLKLRRSPV